MFCFCGRGSVRAAWFCLAVFCGSHFAAADEVKNSVGMSLRLLEAGRYERGDKDLGPGFHKDHADFNTAGDESPRHPVVLTQPFYLATTEVTVAQFKQFVEATGYKTSAEQSPRGAVGWDPKPPPKRDKYVATFRVGDEFDWRNPGFEQADNHPVVGVSYADAKAYCEWLSKKEGATYRLPTEAEWEYASRAGTETYFSFGDQYRGVIHRFANLGNVELEKAFPDRVRRQWLVDVSRDPPDQHVFTAPVASYEANPWGLHDLHGNVWEWCADRYLDTAYTSYERGGYQQVRKRAVDPLNEKPWGEAGDWRVIRGGSWFNSPVQCRSAVRGYFEAGDAACYIGFRVARDASPEQIARAKQTFAASEAARTALEQLVDRVQERRDGRLTIEINQKRGLLTPESLATLNALAEPFDLHVNGQGKLTAEQLAALTSSPYLRGLLINGVGNLTDDDFAGLAKHPQLELLQLTDGAKLTDKLIPHLRPLERLELLQLNSPGITDAGLQSLPELKRLKTLYLSGTGSHGMCLARFQSSPLESFSCQGLSDEGATLLAQFGRLRDVSIGGSPITGPSLAGIARLTQLVRLDLSRCSQLKDADFAVLGGIYNLSSVQLDQTAAGDLAVEGLVRLNNLHQLQIGSPQLTDVGMRKLCGIVSLRGLTITREADQLTDAGLADIWLLSNLEHLNLAAPRITGAGLETIGELAKLRQLNLGGAALEDVACQHIARSESLRQLSIGGGQGGLPALSDAALRFLAASPGLQQVDLFRKGAKVTDEGVAELRRSQPKLKLQAHGP